MKYEKKNSNVYIVINILCVLILLLSGYIVYGKILAKKENSTNANKNDKNQTTNEERLKKYIGIYEVLAILDVEDSKETLTGSYELEIKEDGFCIFRYSVTRGSGWFYEGKCSANETEIILKSTKFHFDSEEENKTEELKFTINGDCTLGYLTDNIQTILKKSLAKTAFNSIVKKYNLKTSNLSDSGISIKDFFSGINARNDEYTLEMYEFSDFGDKSAKEYFEGQKKNYQETNNEQKVLASSSTSKYDIYEATMTLNLENAPAATGDEVEYILQIRIDNYVIILFQESKESDKTKYIHLGKELKDMMNIQ